ncbi:MAG: hypothetical protein ABR558_05415, partial [Thioalkalivibrio sp.]
MAVQKENIIPSEIRRILDARHHDPFSVLGWHQVKGKTIVRAFLPQAAEACVVEAGDAPMQRLEGTDLFQWQG